MRGLFRSRLRVRFLYAVAYLFGNPWELLPGRKPVVTFEELLGEGINRMSFLAGSTKLAISLRASGTVIVSALPMVAEGMRPHMVRRKKNERWLLVSTRGPRPEITVSQT